MASLAEIKGLLYSQTATIQQSISTQIGEVKKEVKGVRDEVQQVKRTQDDHGKRIEGLEAEIKNMKTGSPGSGFASSKIILTNFCDYADKKGTGMSRPEAEALVERLRGLTPDPLKDNVIGLNPLKGTRVYDCAVGIND